MSYDRHYNECSLSSYVHYFSHFVCHYTANHVFVPRMKRRKSYTEMRDLAMRIVVMNTVEIEHVLVTLTEEDFRPILA